MNLTAEFHERHRDRATRDAIEFLADPYALARQYAVEHPEFAANPDADRAFTYGVALATIGGLLDVLGYPEHGPNVGQRSWLPEADDDDEAAATVSTSVTNQQ
jgi:hypothetical protein